jgi:1,4-alpha-glucan branching enzyme
MNQTHAVVYGKGLITDHDVYLFKEGSHFKLYDKLGSHLSVVDGQRGVHFSVWAPNAQSVSVIGDFNGWSKTAHPLAVRWDESGIWEGFIPGLDKGTIYKYHVVSKHNNYKAEKMDPMGFHCETPPKTASIVWDIDYKWGDGDWLAKRHKHNKLSVPISVYEVHLGSWRRNPAEGSKFLSYRELAPDLVQYIKEMGFTHVELLPVMEHPFYGSWGYQSLGYFAPTSRFGTPQDFMSLVDLLHQNDIGVILDWVPSHFPSDEHGLVYFDGTHLYEHSNYKEGFHPDWKSYIFNYGRCEVKNFLISSALFWMDKYHADGLRVDAVASMLYRDYSRKEGEWIPNEFGGRENLQAIDFIKCLNKTLYGAFPDTLTIAEESTAWPMVTRPTSVGGLGFGLKWNMGWMHDTLCYFSKDPIYRKYHHNNLTFSMCYAFTENFALPLSHDEVVHGKGSLIGKMPADDWQKFANLKLLFGYMFTHPGKKLLFMGDEFAQRDEWNHEQSLDWHLLQYYPHQQVKRWVEDLNKLYKSEPALYELDFEQTGFDWIDHMDMEQSVISFTRKGASSDKRILVACNFTPTPRYHYRVGVPEGGFWKEVLNSDSGIYGGSNHGNFGGVDARQEPGHGFGYSLLLTLPPLGIVIFKHD